VKARNFIPEGIKSYLRLLMTKWRYPNRQIGTYMVHPSVQLGMSCRLASNVQIGRNVEIGDYSYANDYTLIGSGKIGKFCSIGYFCEIGMHEHPIDYVSTSPFIYGSKNIFSEECCWDDFASPPIIGNDVWIGSKATILQGVLVSDGAVIAAGSVVTKNVPPYAIVAGVPAKILRYRFNPDKIRALLAMQWWNMPLSKLLQNKSLFRSKDWFEQLSSHISDQMEKAA
jgi:virginiamycin A acetyltransferase